MKRPRKITMLPSIGAPNLQRAAEMMLPLLRQPSPTANPRAAARDRRIGELLVMNARLEKVAGVGRHNG